MPIFNISYFNAGNTFTQLNAVPTPSPYSGIKLWGSAVFDDLWGLTRIMTQQQISALDLNVEPQWSPSTFILAHFNNDLQAGNIVSLPDPIDGWIVLRRTENESKFTKLAELEANVMSYVDKLARSKENYTYQLIPVAGNLLGESLVSDVATTDFTTVNLLDPDTGEGYSFCLDMQLSEIATEEDLTINPTKGKYDTILKGGRQVKVGTIGVLASESYNQADVEQDRLFLETLEEFILNGKEKLIKFPKGMAYRVFTSNWAMSKKDSTKNGNTIYRVSFEYRQVGDL